MTDATAPLRVTLDQIPDGGAVERSMALASGPESWVLLRQGEQLFGYINECPHAGRRMDWAPGRFLLEAGLLICASHGASFNPPDGRCVGGPCRGSQLRALRLERDGDAWWVHPAPAW